MISNVLYFGVLSIMYQGKTLLHDPSSLLLSIFSELSEFLCPRFAHLAALDVAIFSFVSRME